MFKNNKVILILLSMLLVLSFTACGNKNTDKNNKNNTTKVEDKNSNSNEQKEDSKEELTETTYPLTIKDSTGREIVIENEPKTVVSVAPSITEIIFALDKGDALVGRTTYCNYPKEVESIETIGSLSDPVVEKISALKPDVIIASTHFKEEILKKLEELGMKVVFINESQDLEGSYNTIKKIGQILNTNEKANEIVSSMNEKIQGIQSKIKDVEKPSVYFVTGFDYTAGKGTFIGQLIEMAGAVNAANDVEGWQYSLEKLIEKDPNIVIADNYLVEDVKTKNGYKDLTAVKNEKLYGIDPDIFYRPGSPRLAEAFEELVKIIHPEIFK